MVWAAPGAEHEPARRAHTQAQPGRAPPCLQPDRLQVQLCRPRLELLQVRRQASTPPTSRTEQFCHIVFSALRATPVSTLAPPRPITPPAAAPPVAPRLQLSYVSLTHFNTGAVAFGCAPKWPGHNVNDQQEPLREQGWRHPKVQERTERAVQGAVQVMRTAAGATDSRAVLLLLIKRGGDQVARHRLLRHLAIQLLRFPVSIQAGRRLGAPGVPGIQRLPRPARGAGSAVRGIGHVVRAHELGSAGRSA